MSASLLPLPFPKSAAIVCRAVVRAGDKSDAFLVPWKGRLHEAEEMNAKGFIDGAFVAGKAAKLAAKLGVAEVEVWLDATIDPATGAILSGKRLVVAEASK